MSQDTQAEIKVETTTKQTTALPGGANYVGVGSLSREERQELNALSKEVFGATSKWLKYINQGHPVKATTTVKESVPQDDGTEKLVEKQVAKLLPHGAEYRIMKYYTISEVKAMMLDLKEKITAFKEMLKQQEVERQAKETAAKLAKAVQSQAGGSAL